MFYVDIQTGDYTFYYNMAALINENVVDITNNLVSDRPISAQARAYIEQDLKNNLGKRGPRKFGMMGSYDQNTGEIEYLAAKYMAGITAVVSEQIAEQVLERAIYYCPKKTGFLASTGRIENIGDGNCRVYFDCRYAWYVHEFTWVNHEYPTCAKFLTLAIEEVQALLGGSK